MFGGVARMSKDSDSPGTEFKIAVAGPAGHPGDRRWPASGSASPPPGSTSSGSAMRLEPDDDTVRASLAVIAWLATINALVLVFNLIPAFPLDGGRIARAIAWQVTGDRNRATRGAARLGQGFSYLFIGGRPRSCWSTGHVVSGIWLGLIGFILGQSARGAVMQTEFASRIEGIRVADVMDAGAGRDPRGRQRRAGPRRVLPALPLALVPGRRRGPALPRPDRARAADAVPEVSRASSTVARRLRGRLDAARCGCATTRRSSRCWATTRCAGSAALMAVDADGRLRA